MEGGEGFNSSDNLLQASSSSSMFIQDSFTRLFDNWMEQITQPILGQI